MNILIMRHGEASFTASSDMARELTAQGSLQCKLVANWLQLSSLPIDRVIVSPYTRAKQTLAIVQKGVKIFGKIEESSMVTPSAETDYIKAYLYTLAHQQLRGVLIVSHLPFVGYLVNALCPDVAPPTFHTAALACIELDPVTNAGEFKWMR